jgi:hypothetical protein
VIPVVIGAFVAGALVMGRTKPKTSVVKKTLLGPFTGKTYEAEDFPLEGFVVVRDPDGSVGCFRRLSMLPGHTGKPGFVFSNGRGNPATVAAMRRDFDRKLLEESRKPSAT